MKGFNEHNGDNGDFWRNWVNEDNRAYENNEDIYQHLEKLGIKESGLIRCRLLSPMSP